MRKLSILFAAILLTSCTMGEGEVKERTLVYRSFLYDIHKVRVDSVDYLVAITSQGVSIIKK